MESIYVTRNASLFKKVKVESPLLEYEDSNNEDSNDSDHDDHSNDRADRNHG